MKIRRLDCVSLPNGDCETTLKALFKIRKLFINIYYYYFILFYIQISPHFIDNSCLVCYRIDCVSLPNGDCETTLKALFKIRKLFINIYYYYFILFYIQISPHFIDNSCLVCYRIDAIQLYDYYLLRRQTKWRSFWIRPEKKCLLWPTDIKYVFF